MRKQAFAALAAAAMIVGGSAGAATADTTELFVDVASPKDGTVYQLGEEVPVDGAVGAGSVDPWNIVFVVDASGSTFAAAGDKSVFEQEQLGGKELLKSLQTAENDVNMSVVYFADSAEGIELTTDMDKIDEALSYEHGVGLSDVGGGTSCDAGLEKAGEVLKGAKGNKRIYFLTDGHCHGNPAFAAKALKDQGIEIFPVHAGESTGECVHDQIDSDKCVKIKDPAELSVKLPESVTTVKTLNVTITNEQGDVVKEFDLSKDLTKSITQDWKLDALTGLPAGKYTVTADATDTDGNTAQDVTHFVIEAPEPEPEPEPEPTPTPTPEPEPRPKPGLPSTGR